MDSRNLVLAARAAQGLTSNDALARTLGVPSKSVQRWHTGKHTPDDVTAERLAELAGIDSGPVVAAMHAQRATEPAERALWERLAARLEKAGAAATAAILALFITITPDGGATLGGAAHAKPVHNVSDALYIVHSWLTRLARWLSPPLGGLVPHPA